MRGCPRLDEFGEASKRRASGDPRGDFCTGEAEDEATPLGPGDDVLDMTILGDATFKGEEVVLFVRETFLRLSSIARSCSSVTMMPKSRAVRRATLRRRVRIKMSRIISPCTSVCKSPQGDKQESSLDVEESVSKPAVSEMSDRHREREREVAAAGATTQQQSAESAPKDERRRMVLSSIRTKEKQMDVKQRRRRKKNEKKFFLASCHLTVGEHRFSRRARA